MCWANLLGFHAFTGPLVVCVSCMFLEDYAAYKRWLSALSSNNPPPEGLPRRLIQTHVHARRARVPDCCSSIICIL